MPVELFALKGCEERYGSAVVVNIVRGRDQVVFEADVAFLLFLGLAAVRALTFGWSWSRCRGRRGMQTAGKVC